MAGVSHRESRVGESLEDCGVVTRSTKTKSRLRPKFTKTRLKARFTRTVITVMV